MVQFRNAYATIEELGALLVSARAELAAKEPGAHPNPNPAVNAALSVKLMPQRSSSPTY